MSHPNPSSLPKRHAWVLALVLSLSVAGCGSRRSPGELLADATAQGGAGLPSPEVNTQPGPSTNNSPDGGVAAESEVPAPNDGVRVGAEPNTVSPGRTATLPKGGKTDTSTERPATATPNENTPGAVRPQTPVGSDGGNPTANSGGPSGPVVCSTALTPLVIGTVGEQSGPVGATVFVGVQAVQAWVASVNAKGGLKCHPIRYIVADDGGDPARHQSLVQKLVEENRVLAFVYMDAPVAGEAGVKYLTQKRIPVIGSEGGGTWFYESPMYFPQMSSGDGTTAGLVGAAAEVGRIDGMPMKVASMTCVEVALCNRIYDQMPAWAEKFGLTLVYRGKGSIAQPDFTSHCQAAQSAGAGVFIVGADANTASRVTRSCKAVNYAPTFAVTQSASNLKHADDPNMDGSSVGMSVLPWTITSHPGIAEFHNVLKRYAPGVQPQAGTIVAWVAAKLFELAGQNLSEPPTSQSILEGLWSIKDSDLGGMTQPLTFTKDQNAPRLWCWFVLQLKNGQYVSPNNAQRTCLAGEKL